MEAGQKRKEFKVVLHDIELSEKQERALSAAIQRTVSDQLAHLDLDGDGERHLVEIGGRFPDWIGREIALIAAGRRLQAVQSAVHSPGNVQPGSVRPGP